MQTQPPKSITPERWRRIEDLYHAARGRTSADSAVFLAEACGGDADLRREVESLLAEDGSRADMLERPALPADSAKTGAGSQFGPYRIEASIGKGGMGEVWKARDSRLNRDVAIKISAQQFTGRFEREARAIAALNHPNICTLYDIGPNYLVMELVEGPTLAERIKRGPIPVDEALNIAKQIASALEAAHDKGIVHRDLKPANIKIRPDGSVKVLDFGLAKTSGDEAGISPDSQTMTMTAPGTIMGAPGYMPPEQLRGEKVDKRADIWAFGVVLFEMTTGAPPFKGETISDTLAAVIKEEPDWQRAPANVQRLLQACLEKDPRSRLRDIGDMKRLLEEPPGPAATRRGRLAWIAVAVFAVTTAALAFVHLREQPPAQTGPLHFQIQAPEYLYVSPDGRRLAFVSGGRLGVQFLDSGESRDLTATDGGAPFWSPDSRFIGYLAEGKLKKIEATGGLPQTVTDLRSNFLWGCGAWNQDDVIVFGDRLVGLFRVPASGGVPVQITALDSAHHENSHYCPSFLPDGRHFVYIRAATDEGTSAIYLGSPDAKPEQQSTKALVASNSQPVYAPSADPNTGYLLFIRGGTLTAQPFDNRRLELKGQAVPVAEQVTDKIAGAIFVSFSASANDVLVFQRGTLSNRRFAWFDREGKVLGTIGESGTYGANAELSPDGTRLAVTKNSGRAEAANIWLLDLSRGGAMARFTFGSLMDQAPVWSPDGSRIIFSSNREGPYNLYQKPVNGVKDEEVLLKSGEDKHATSWSHDGAFLLYRVVHPKTKGDLWVLPLDHDKKPVPFLVTEFNEGQARFSPDGHWVAYTSDESGQNEVYVRSFSMNPARTAVEASGKWPISNGYGIGPRWRGDGRELFYSDRNGRVLAVEIATSPAFRAGKPQPLGYSTKNGSWNSAADGKRFLGLGNDSGSTANTVVLNWQAGLKK